MKIYRLLTIVLFSSIFSFSQEVQNENKYYNEATSFKDLLFKFYALDIETDEYIQELNIGVYSEEEALAKFCYTGEKAFKNLVHNIDAFNPIDNDQKALISFLKGILINSEVENYSDLSEGQRFYKITTALNLINESIKLSPKTFHFYKTKLYLINVLYTQYSGQYFFDFHQSKANEILIFLDSFEELLNSKYVSFDKLARKYDNSLIDFKGNSIDLLADQEDYPKNHFWYLNDEYFEIETNNYIDKLRFHLNVVEGNYSKALEYSGSFKDEYEKDLVQMIEVYLNYKNRSYDDVLKLTDKILEKDGYNNPLRFGFKFFKRYKKGKHLKKMKKLLSDEEYKDPFNAFNYQYGEPKKGMIGITKDEFDQLDKKSKEQYSFTITWDGYYLSAIGFKILVYNDLSLDKEVEKYKVILDDSRGFKSSSYLNDLPLVASEEIEKQIDKLFEK